MHQEHVLVVPTAAFRRVGYFQGFCGETQRYMEELLRPELMSFRPRAEMERNPDYKQLIPYVIFRHVETRAGESLFCYTRGSGQGEQRLHRKRSIGIGGHISVDDAVEVGHEHAYAEGMRRELAEEVAIHTPFVGRCAGLINDDETEVGTVHLGVVHILDVDRPHVEAREADIVAARFVPTAELLRELADFESWSRICLEALFAESSTPR